MTKIVNSWNEWDPLKHVIVGKADNCCIPPAEPATDPKIPEDSDMQGVHGPRSEESIIKANIQLDNFAKIPLNSSLLSNINENKSELILDENYIIEKLPDTGSLRYIENDFSIEHKFELKNNILKFKRIICVVYIFR